MAVVLADVAARQSKGNHQQTHLGQGMEGCWPLKPETHRLYRLRTAMRLCFSLRIAGKSWPAALDKGS